jgi:hypothetical protein
MSNRMMAESEISRMGCSSTQSGAEDEAGPTDVGALSRKGMREDRGTKKYAGSKQQIR